jgi:hypothetical protein
MSTSTMTPATPPEPSPEPPEGVSAPGPGPEGPSGDEGQNDERDESGRYLSREAASYRRRLRDTETERDQLREQLDRLQRAEVERLASAAGLQVAGDVCGSSARSWSTCAPRTGPSTQRPSSRRCRS